MRNTPIPNMARLALAFLLITSASHAAPLDPAEARNLVRERLAELQHYEADFTQVVTDGSGEQVEKATGRFWLQRPGLFRWEYLTPWPRLILSDGERIWLYDEELEQVTVRDFDGVLEQTPAALLAGRLELLDGYGVSGQRSDDIVTIELVPEQMRADFRAIKLAYVGDTLTEMRLLDSFGQQTRISFSGINRATRPEQSRFEFVVPDGVDVIDESSSGAAAAAAP